MKALEMGPFRQPNDDVAAEAAERQMQLTKPPGSLGLLEKVAIQLAGWQGQKLPSSRPAAAVVFAADHPVVKHGVSAYPQEVTRAMVENFLAGGAAVNVACRLLRVPLRVVDVGLQNAVSTAPSVDVPFRRAAVADGEVGDLRYGCAMSTKTFEAAVCAGAEEIDALPEDTRFVLLGEMGIGNTTAAAAVSAALLQCPGSHLVGPGTGVAGEALKRKVQVVEEAVAHVRGEGPRGVVQSVGGRDIAALIGAASRALQKGMAVLVDGFIVSAAMLALVKMYPQARAGLFFSHQSQEPGHRLILKALDASPLLHLDMRLGEASGALAALPLLDMACALHGQMATFSEAGIR